MNVKHFFISESPSGTSCPYWETSGDCCTNCDINYGDCDSDNDCLSGLVCEFDGWWGNDFCRAGKYTTIL